MSPTPTKEGLMRWVDDYAVRMNLDARETLFLTKFAAFADAAMEAWAAMKTLAERARSSERKAQYMLRDFEGAGVIRRTGRMHRIPGTTRDVPMYVFCGYLAELNGEAAMGAQRAPMRGDGCTDAGGMGAQGVHPHNEPIELTLPVGSDAHTQAREALFAELEAAFPKRGLAFTNRERAWTWFCRLLDEGLDVADLIRAAKAFAAAVPARLKDLGLDYWLADRRYRGTWPEPQLAFEDSKPSPSAASHPSAAPAEDQAIWLRVADQLRAGMTEATFGSWLRPCALCADGPDLYLVALNGVARDWLKNNAGRRIAGAWAEHDRLRRALTIVSKVEFEGVQRRTLEGAT